MPGNSFGEMFRITNFGESHGKVIGVVVDGCPPLIKINEKYIQKFLDRRAGGQSELTTKRHEPDKVQILSGVFKGKTTGAPICMIIFNKDFRKQDYKEIANVFRPGHADFSYQEKYGIRDPYGGGRSSARLTAANVAAGALAYKILNERFKIEIVAYIKQIKDIEADVNIDGVTLKDVESNIVRCPDKNAAKKMIELIKNVINSGDSVGGVIECVIRNVPPGLGEPIFDKLGADFAKAIMCINAAKGFEIGSGFGAAKMLGSEHNDAFIAIKSRIKTKTNNSGGIQGGISNGMPIIFRVAFKPTPTIKKLYPKGRYDPCIVLRAVPIIESMAALVLCDHYLRDRAQCDK